MRNLCAVVVVAASSFCLLNFICFRFCFPTHWDDSGKADKEFADETPKRPPSPYAASSASANNSDRRQLLSAKGLLTG
ncbi:hypothetical protein F5B19DRAFT_451683 [Rostrohypoxylon terebratum]|nr:hypothetical protein F5B19DRAFT_451683 [Rostrohypoxylon terebratum]